MNAVLDIYDERRPGTERELRHRLELPVKRMTARDLIRCRIEADVAIHNAVERAHPRSQRMARNPERDRASAPPGIYPHFAGEFFKIKTGTDILFVPYKGGTAAITDMIGGHIDMVFNPKSSLLAHFKAGKLKALAVTSEARWPELPDTPTMLELGVAGFPKEIWFGLLAPVGTPATIVGRLNHAVNEGLRSEEVRSSLAKLGIEARIGTAQDFAAALSEQVRDWKVVVDATGIKIE
jgi:tripartite-type tricarboxylate transporter receptor subunit TctC